MNKFALLGLFGIIASSSAFSPNAVNKGAFSTKLSSTKLTDVGVSIAPPTPEIAAPASPETPAPAAAKAAPTAYDKPYFGERPVVREAIYVSVEHEYQSVNKERLSNPLSFANRLLGPISLMDIVAQQHQHGLHTSSDRFDYTRNCMRN